MNIIHVINALDSPKRFWGTLRKYPFRLVGCTVVVMSIMCAVVSLGDSLKEDSDRILILGCEMLCECGPDFEAAAERHLEITESYIEYVKGRRLTTAVSSLLSEKSPEEDLKEAAKILRSWAGGPQEAGKAIWRAGEYLVTAHMHRQGFPRLAVTLPRIGSSPKWVLDRIEGALSECDKQLKFCDFRGALALCEANRRAMLLIFLSRNHDVKEHVTNFRVIVAEAASKTHQLADRLAGDQRVLVDLVAASEDRRLAILAAMENDPTDKDGLAAECMWEAVDHAADNRDTILAACSRLGFGKGL